MGKLKDYLRRLTAVRHETAIAAKAETAEQLANQLYYELVGAVEIVRHLHRTVKPAASASPREPLARQRCKQAELEAAFGEDFDRLTTEQLAMLAAVALSAPEQELFAGAIRTPLPQGWLRLRLLEHYVSLCPLLAIIRFHRGGESACVQ